MIQPPDDIAAVLPPDMSPAKQSDLFRRLIQLRTAGEWYMTALDDPDPLQGDAWEKVDFVDVDRLTKSRIRTVVLSNTCDTSRENRRAVPIMLAISPLVRLSRYTKLAEDEGLSGNGLVAHVDAIRKQDVTNIFYFPAEGRLDDEYIVRFDIIQSQAPTTFSANVEKKRLVTLSQAAFWLFLVKLSTHLCRPKENLDRDRLGIGAT
jgi:hypothetical protein